MPSKKEQIIQLFSSTYKSKKDIAVTVGVNPSYVTKVLSQIDTSVAVSNRVNIIREEMLELLLTKLRHFAQSEKPSEFRAFCEGLKRLSELCGMDAPKQVEVTHKWPDEIIYEIKPNDQ